VVVDGGLLRHQGGMHPSRIWIFLLLPLTSTDTSWSMAVRRGISLVPRSRAHCASCFAGEAPKKHRRGYGHPRRLMIPKSFNRKRTADHFRLGRLREATHGRFEEALRLIQSISDVASWKLTCHGLQANARSRWARLQRSCHFICCDSRLHVQIDTDHGDSRIELVGHGV
jgi:hypothetical protein